MALPTGSFSDLNPGLLQVTLTADFTSHKYNDAGFPSSGSGNIALRGYFGPSGARSYTAVVDKFSRSASISINYPGGNAAWPVGVESLGYAFVGIGAISMTNIKLSFQLIKR